MKKRILVFSIIIALIITAAIFLLTPRHKTPTAAQLQKAFPADSKRIFESSEKFILLSLDPSHLGNYKGRDSFHGYRIVDQTQVTDASSRDNLIATIYDGIAEDDGNQADCFSPRHGIRAVKAGKTIDLVICFSCGRVEIHTDSDKTLAPTSKGRQPLFDRTLRTADASLSPH